MCNFKQFPVYQRTVSFAKVVGETTENFPKQEWYGLGSQFRKAADATVLNTAEGAGNSSLQEFSRVLEFIDR